MFVLAAAFLLLGLPAQPSGAFAPPIALSLGKYIHGTPRHMPRCTFDAVPKSCKRRIQQFSSVGLVSIVSSPSSTNIDSPTLQTLSSGIKAVGVGKKGSKPIPQELVPQLIEIVRCCWVCDIPLLLCDCFVLNKRQRCSINPASFNDDWKTDDQVLPCALQLLSAKHVNFPPNPLQ